MHKIISIVKQRQITTIDKTIVLYYYMDVNQILPLAAIFLNIKLLNDLFG